MASAGGISHNLVAAVVLIAWGLVLAMLALTLVMDAELFISDEALGFWALVPALAMPASLASVGMLLLLRLPASVIGWLMLLSGVVLALTAVGSAFQTGPAAEQDPAGLLRIWLEQPLVIVGLVLALLVVPFFPSGKVVGVGRVATGVLVAGAIVATLGRLSPFAGEAPGADAVVLQQVGGALRFAGTVAILAGLAVVIADLFVRYSRADPAQRAQMVLFVIVATVLAASAVLVAADVGDFSILAWLVLVASIALLPVTVAVAILRHGLYNVDLLVGSAVVYILLVSILGGAYILGVQAMYRVSIAVTGSRSDAAVVMALLIAVAFFTPLKKYLDKRVDSWFAARESTEQSADADMNAASAVDVDMTDLDARMEQIARKVVAEEAAMSERSRDVGRATSARRADGDDSAGRAPTPPR